VGINVPCLSNILIGLGLFFACINNELNATVPASELDAHRKTSKTDKANYATFLQQGHATTFLQHRAIALSGAINSIPALVRNTIKIFSQALLKETGDDNIAAATALLIAVSQTVVDVIPNLVDTLVTSET
jgi:hypothetical protein